MKIKFWGPPSPLNIAFLTGQWGKSGPLLLLSTKSHGEQQKWTTFHEFLHGLLSHIVIGFQWREKAGGTPLWPPGGFFLGFYFFFENWRRGLARLLKLYKVFILTKK